LGLAISKRIIEMHGGRILVDSEIGKGATFTVNLPVSAEGKVPSA
jgi:signal transduction histidine kinase